MLEPQARRHLLESLRPPLGYTLDGAVGTTFSLDLLALLITPVAFTFFDWEDIEGRPAADPLAMLEAVRRHCDHISLFCQAGQIHIPKGIDHRLCAYLESSIIQVSPKKAQRVFHPKVWLLRFTQPDHPVKYRLLCLSRNLTFDRSWDTILALDGTVVNRRNAFGANNPLGDFVATLPELAIRPVPDTVQARIDLIQHEVRRVEFTLPGDFTSVAFWPQGIRRGAVWPFPERANRMLVISPFLSDGCLSRLVDGCHELHLVSRPESLDAVPAQTLSRCRLIFSLHSQAMPDDAAEEAGKEALDGLHAKLFLAESGRDARLWTGSANATENAFDGNVELLVELSGKKTRCGIDMLIGASADRMTLRDLLHPYTPSAEPVVADPVQQTLQQQVDQARQALAKAGLVARVMPDAQDDVYRLQIEGNHASLPPGVSIACWPITLAESSMQPLGTDSSQPLAVFAPVSFEALTAFFAFIVTAERDDRSAHARFVLNLPLLDAPADRRERVLRSLLSTRDQVLRYLLLLLAEGESDVPGVWEALRQVASGEASRSQVTDVMPLLECLLRAADRHPDKLEQVRRLVEDLCRQPNSEGLLPKGFLSIWEPIRAVVIGESDEPATHVS